MSDPSDPSAPPAAVRPGAPPPGPRFHLHLLDAGDPAVAERMHAVLALASAQEAALLGLLDAPGRGTRSAASLRWSGELFVGAAGPADAPAAASAPLLGLLALGPDDEPGQIAIRTLVVHPDHQRRGVGRALVLDALGRGPGQVFSVVAGSANVPALALYASLGFEVYRHGRLDGAAVEMLKLRRRAPGDPPA